MNWLQKLQNFRVKSLACGLFVLASASPSFADWTICNRTPEEVYAAIAFDNGGGYVSSGWYRFEVAVDAWLSITVYPSCEASSITPTAVTAPKCGRETTSSAPDQASRSSSAAT